MAVGLANNCRLTPPQGQSVIKCVTRGKRISVGARKPLGDLCSS